MPVRLSILLLLALGMGSVQAAGFLDQPAFSRVAVPEVETLGGVFAMAQDSRGFMWFAGKNGLARYDGYRVDLYRHDPDDPTSLSSNDIHDLWVDRRGQLWIATLSGGGLNRFDFTTGTFVRYVGDPENPHDMDTRDVYALAEDSHGGMWLATHDRGVLRQHLMTGKFMQVPQLAGLSVRDLAIDRLDYIWVATADHGLYRLHTTRPEVEVFRAATGLSDDRLFRVYVDAYDNVWIGTLEGGLNRFDRATGRFTHYRHGPQNPDSLGAGVVWDIREDSAGDLWVATGDGALNRFDKWRNRFERFYPEEYSPRAISGPVVSLFLDTAGDLWLGTYHSALHRYTERGPQFQVLRHKPGVKDSLLSSSIMALAEDAEGWIWAASDRGLSRFQMTTGHFEHWLPDATGAGLPLAPLRSLAAAEDRLWLGTAGQGVWWWKDGEFGHLPEGLLQDDRVWALLPQSGGRLWMGTQSGGLTLFDPQGGTATTYRADPSRADSLSHDFVWTLLQDKAGHLWVGTQRGLNRLDSASGNFVQYLHVPGDPQSLSDNSVRALAEGPGGEIWVGTAAGLNRLEVKSGRFEVFRRRDGLADDHVTGLVVDESGLLWATTQRGLSRYDAAENRFRNFDVRHGVAGNAHPRKSSALRSAGGHLFFGGASGITALNPHGVKDNVHEAQVQLTGLWVNNQRVIGPPLLAAPLELTHRLILGHHQNVFTLEFAALNFLVPEQNRYAYRLEGFDDDWRITDSGNRRVSYTNLPPGHYQFQVRSANNDGLWSRHTAQLHIHIQPPWWRTFPTYGAVVLALCLLGYMLLQRWRRLRLRRLANARRMREMDHMKRHFLDHIGREMRSPLDAIAGLVAGLLRPDEEDLSRRAHQQLAVVQQQTVRLMQLARELEDFTGAESAESQLPGRPLELAPVLDTTLSWFRSAAERKSLQLIRNLPDDLPQVVANSVSLQQILYCLLDNAITHTRDGYVEVSAVHLPEVEENGRSMVLVQVTDTGAGMTAAQVAGLWRKLEQRRRHLQGAEIGLDLLRARDLVRQQGGDLSVRSEPQQGSTFAFTLPAV